MSDWGRIKVALLILLLFSQAAFLWGCGIKSGLAPDSESENGIESEPGTKAGSETKILAPVKLNYTVTNPLSVEEHREEDGNNFDYGYVTVSGLRDEAVQQKINDRIKEVYDGLRVQDLPPYRGIRVLVPEGSHMESERINANVTGNFNHILSIMFYKEASYLPSGLGGLSGSIDYGLLQYVSEMETLNFDLNTGEEFELAELFCDNVAPAELLSDWMSAFLARQQADEEQYYPGSYWGDIKLAESFKGVGENQKFCVYPYGIALVFDYLTPQLDTGRRAAAPVASFGDLGETLAVSERFFRENGAERIFTSDKPPVKALVVRNFRMGEQKSQGGEEHYQEGSVSIDRSWQYPPSLPEKLRLELERMTAADQKTVRELRRIWDNAATTESAEDVRGFYEIRGESDEAGNYINLSRNSQGYTLDRFLYDTECRCYDKDTLAELGLADIFAEGYDYKPVILKAIQEQVSWKENDTSGRSKEQIAEDIFRSIRGFNLEENGLRLPAVDPGDGIEQHGMSLSIPYDDFECENLKIFH